MKYGICPLSVVTIRNKASDTSEVVSQLLFGETILVIKERAKWAKIKCTWDDCEGWIDNRQYEEISEKEFTSIQAHTPAYALEIAQGAMAYNHFIPLPMGATLPLYDGINFKLRNVRYTYSGQVISPKDITLTAEIILRVARKYLYAPYFLGGRSPFGIDAAGFTQMVFKLLGLKIGREAAQQATHGEVVNFTTEAQAGDLAFFENDKGNIIHVGIVFPENKVIHVSGQVRIDNLDHYGIYNTTTNSYTHKLRLIKRFL